MGVMVSTASWASASSCEEPTLGFRSDLEGPRRPFKREGSFLTCPLSLVSFEVPPIEVVMAFEKRGPLLSVGALPSRRRLPPPAPSRVLLVL